MISTKNKLNKDYKGFKIYSLTNELGFIYIGATTNLERRLKTYEKYPAVYKKQKKLSLSILNYGFGKHKVKVLYTFDGDFKLEDMVAIEDMFIQKVYLENPTKTLNSIIRGTNHRLVKD